MPQNQTRGVMLKTRKVEKVWGRDHLPPPFAAPPGKRIGEIWFEPPPELRQLLVKYLFTSDKLSVQVHPSDEQAIEGGLGRQGKEECWLIIAADPGAVIGIGFEHKVTRREMRAAATDGQIENLMRWQPVKAGDFYYIPANTVHAIGAGVCLVEIQQNSDITYRLYDYGRPRPLHLNEGISCAHGEPFHDRRNLHLPERGEVRLVDGPHFRLARYDGPLSPELAAHFAAASLLVVPLRGEVAVSGWSVQAGCCALARRAEDFTPGPNALGLIAQPAA